jgi:hypothetical protein
MDALQADCLIWQDEPFGSPLFSLIVTLACLENVRSSFRFDCRIVHNGTEPTIQEGEKQLRAASYFELTLDMAAARLREIFDICSRIGDDWSRLPWTYAGATEKAALAKKNAASIPHNAGFPDVDFFELQRMLELEFDLVEERRSRGTDDSSAVSSNDRNQPSVDARACAMLIQHPKWTKAKIAEEIGTNPKYLSQPDKVPNFVAAWNAIHEPRRPPRHGSKSKDGKIEAVGDEDLDFEELDRRLR